MASRVCFRKRPPRLDILLRRCRSVRPVANDTLLARELRGSTQGAIELLALLRVLLL